MASVSASDVSDMNDNQDYIALNGDSDSVSSVNDNLILSASDSFSDDSSSISTSNDVSDDAAISYSGDSISTASSNDDSTKKSASSGDSSKKSSDAGSQKLSDSEDTKTSTTIVESSTKVVKGENYSVTLKDKDGNVLSGKKLVFTFNGKDYNRTTNSNGIASLTLNAKPMDYSIKVRFLGDELYEASSLSNTVTVSKISTNIKNYSSSAVNGKIYYVILKDKYGSPLSSKKVSLSFNGKTFTRTTSAKGLVGLTLKATGGKNYVLSYKFAGDSSYQASSGSVSFKLKMPTKITVSSTRIVKGKVFSMTLKDENNKAVSKKKITMVFDGSTYSRTTDSKGIAKLKMNRASGKYYNLTCKFAGDGSHDASSKTSSIFIKTPTKLLNSGSFVCKGNLYSVTLKDINNKPIAKKTISIVYRSKTYKRTTNANGLARMTINSPAGNVYKFTYKFAGDSLYGASSASLNLRTKLATTLTGSSSTIIKGNAYKVTLKDQDGKAIAKQKVVFNFSGSIYNRTTDSKGSASLTIRPSKIKTYALSYSYAGNSKYNKSSKSINLAVKLPTVMKNGGTTAVNNSTYMVSLNDGDSKPLANRTITFTLDGKTYKNTTNANGVARLFISESKLKKTQLTYKFAGDSQYAASSGSVDINIVSDKVFTFNQIVSAAKSLRSYVEKNGKVPDQVTLNGVKVNLSSFAYLMSKAIVNVNGGKKISVNVVPVSSNYSNSGQAVVKGNLNKANYVKLSNYIINFTLDNKRISNCPNTSLGRLSPNLYIYGFSKALEFYGSNNYLPNYIILDSDDVNGKTSSRGNAAQFKKGLNEVQVLNATELAKYLKSSGNDAVNTAIKNLAKSLVSGKSSTWAKANAIFQYVRDNIDYEYYADTRYKATGTLSNKRGNCCDHANLVVALCRAAGISARYSHAQGCRFSSGLVAGHVWAQIYVDGVWYTADATSHRNGLGDIQNWNTNSYNTLKQYVHLPF